MREATGQAADRFHALRALQTGFEALALGDFRHLSAQRVDPRVGPVDIGLRQDIAIVQMTRNLEALGRKAFALLINVAHRDDLAAIVLLTDAGERA